MNAKKKKRIITILIILFVLFFGRPYYKPAYSGRVVDLDTGEPIVGAIVDVEYWTGGYGLVEQYSNKIYWRRTITDKNGFFEFRVFFTLTRLFSYDDGVTFSILKDNYTEMNNFDMNECLSVGCEEKTFSTSDEKKKISISSNMIKLRNKNPNTNSLRSKHPHPEVYPSDQTTAPWRKVFGPLQGMRKAPTSTSTQKLNN